MAIQVTGMVAVALVKMNRRPFVVTASFKMVNNAMMATQQTGTAAVALVK